MVTDIIMNNMISDLMIGIINPVGDGL